MRQDAVRFRTGKFRFRLELRARQLWREPDGSSEAVEVPLPPRQFELLALFVRNPNIALTKGQLIEAGWAKDYALSDGTLAKAVGELRRLIGDTAGSRVIATVTKTGYRFTGTIDGPPAPTTPSRPEPAATSEARFNLWRANAGAIFAPSPIREEERFVGREHELRTAFNHLVTGHHVLLHGPMGAGKSSLANILAIKFARDKSWISCRAEVNHHDTFVEINRKIRAAIRGRIGLTDSAGAPTQTPSELAHELNDLAEQHPFAMILDEFQRKMTPEAAVGISELLKGLTDRSARARFIVVGVADNIADLTAAHESLALRHLLAVSIGTMTKATTLEIVRRGFDDMAGHGWPDLVSSPDLETIGESIAGISLGLPTIVTGLARTTAYAALDNLAMRIVTTDFKTGLQQLTADYATAMPGIDLRQLARDSYLVACAASGPDSRGYRTVLGAAATYKLLTGRSITGADFATKLLIHQENHVLKQGPNVGDVQFVVGLVPPYLLVAALAEGTVKLAQVLELWRHSTDQILDELKYLFSEIVRKADNGKDAEARTLYERFMTRLAFAEQHVLHQSDYASQRERLKGLNDQLPDLRKMIDLGEAPTVG